MTVTLFGPKIYFSQSITIMSLSWKLSFLLKKYLRTYKEIVTHIQGKRQSRKNNFRENQNQENPREIRSLDFTVFSNPEVSFPRQL